MAENKFKVHSKQSGKPGNSLFNRIEKTIQLESLFEDGFPVAYLPKILFVFALGLLYIGNTHFSEKTIRKINNLQTEVEDLRADYTTLKADLMFASKQSEVAKRVKGLGLNESLKPPQKILVKKSEY